MELVLGRYVCGGLASCFLPLSMLTVLLIALPLLAMGGVTTLFAVLRAPEGYEDDVCYHPEPRSLPTKPGGAGLSAGGRISAL